jgi:hypothetical protein
MAVEQHALNVSDNPAMKALVAEVCRTRQPRVLRDEETGAEVVVRPAPKRSPSRARPVGRDDALFQLIGIGHSGRPSNASEHKHEALEEAYRAHHSS